MKRSKQEDRKQCIIHQKTCFWRQGFARNMLDERICFCHSPPLSLLEFHRKRCECNLSTFLPPRKSKLSKSICRAACTNKCTGESARSAESHYDLIVRMLIRKKTYAHAHLCNDRIKVLSFTSIILANNMRENR